MFDLPFWALCLLGVFVGYGLGSIPFGLILYKMAGKGDIRATGSGNIGATNVLRSGGKKLAALTLLLDAGKGALAIAVLYMIGGAQDFSYVMEVCDGPRRSDCVTGTMVIFPWPMALAGFFALIGHMYPFALGFRGGKGVATFLGMALALHPQIGLLCAVIWFLSALAFRISSLSALIAVASTPLLAIVFSMIVLESGSVSLAFAYFYAVFYLCCAALIYWKHRANISRLINGTEPKIGKK
jgi:glycerol-3-phosphate acyltransferase PlsY